MSSQMFGLVVHAEGEVRRADGSLRHTVSADSDTVQVSLEELKAAVEKHGTSDDRLRELGFSEDTIRQIRSTA